MKRKRILLGALLCALLITVFSVTSFASTEDTESRSKPMDILTSIFDIDEDNTTDAPAPVEDSTEVEETENGESSLGDKSDDGDRKEDGLDDEIPKDGASADNVFEILLEEVKLHAGEIFSALALIASLVLAYFYKCGLMPIIKNSLNAISNVLTDIEKSADESSKTSAETIDALKSRLECAEGVIDRLGESVSVMSDDLKTRSVAATDAADTRVILSAQVDMLYDIFMTSALPQYQKDAVGEKIAAMREVLAGNDNEQTD